MADQLTVINELDLEFAFVDGDTRTQKLTNPTEVTVAQIEDLQTFCRVNNALIGDKVGSTFGRIKKVVRRSGTKTKIDLG